MNIRKTYTNNIKNKKLSKKERIKTLKTKTKNNTKITIAKLSKNSKIVCGILLLISFIISLYIRIVPSYDKVFNNPSGSISFATDDAVMHMRIVENLVINFPHKIWFEVFTLYPYGQPIHFGPLMSYMIAIPALLIGLGSPSVELIRTIGAFYPAVMGALMIIPVFVIGKEVFNTRTGIFAASIIAIIPGPFFTRSVLGFTDHHIGEVFFSTLFIMFFIITTKYVQNNTLNNGSSWKVIKPYFVLASITGISFGLYMLQWSCGIFFAGIIAITMFVQILKDHKTKSSIEGTYFVTIIIFTSAFLVVGIFVDPINGFTAGRYSNLHVFATIGCALAFSLMYLLSRYMNKKQLGHKFIPTIMSIIVFFIVYIKVSVPKVFSIVTEFFGMFSPRTGGYGTIGEAAIPSTTFIQNSFPGIIPSLSSYTIALIGLLVVSILLIKKWNVSRWIFVVWSITIFLLTLGQVRWFYYYAVNVALLSSFIGISLLDIAGYTHLTSKYKTYKELLQNSNKHYISLISVVSVFILIVSVLILPLYIVSSNSNHGIVGSQYYNWHESLTWMRYNTPETGLNFNTTYGSQKLVREDGINKIIYEGSIFEYPETAYGIMSWWDYGHVITYIAHRIPNANPFQAGIGGGPTHEPGASTFFTSTSEEDAYNITQKLGSKYIISDAYMAYSIINIMGIWNYHNHSDYFRPIVISGNDQMTYAKFWYETMEGKLHIFDGNELQHFRLVHESEPNPYVQGGHAEQRCKAIFNLIYEGNVQIENTGYIKTFEVVKGAVVTGKAPSGSVVTIYNTIITNQNRTFVYQQSTVAENGIYELTIPYSTLGPNEGETNFDTKPTGQFTIYSKFVNTQFDISETDVLDGNTNIVNLV